MIAFGLFHYFTEGAPVLAEEELKTAEGYALLFKKGVIVTSVPYHLEQ